MPKRISRRSFIAGLGATGAAALAVNKLRGVYDEELISYLPKILNQPSQERYNVVSVMCDTVRHDHIGFFGNSDIQTPNIDEFAGQSVVFDRAYSAGFPTVLNRAEFLTGKYMYARMTWEDLPPGELVLPTLLNEAGYTTGLIFDTPHFKDGNFTLNRAFQSWEWVRGQASDRWRAVPVDPPLPADPSKFRDVEAVKQYLRNMSDRQGVEDYLPGRTIRAAIEWLREVRSHNNFYLHIDSFDPHEPWDPPQHYVDLYNPGYIGEEVIDPAYAPPDYLTPEELTHIHALYQAELTMVDHWIGELLAEIDALGLTNNTIVIFLSDHGFLFGEHNAVGKSWDHEGHYQAYPLYEELIHIPIMMRIPGHDPKRSLALVQPADILPTILDLLSVDIPGTVEARSLRPIIENDTPIHDAVVSSRGLKPPLLGNPIITVTDGRWSLHFGGDHATSALYDLDNDPDQQSNLLESQCGVARELHTEFLALLDSLTIPEENISPWRLAPC